LRIALWPCSLPDTSMTCGTFLRSPYVVSIWREMEIEGGTERKLMRIQYKRLDKRDKR